MEAPNLNRIKEIIATKGYGDLFEVESTLSRNTISGEIPLDFLYKIVMNEPVIKVVRKVLLDSKFVPDSIPDIDNNTAIIRQFIEKIDKDNLLPNGEGDQPVHLDTGLSKLLFIGVRSVNFGVTFDDLLIVTTREGDIFGVFEVCTDLDFRRSLPQITSSNPICIKPGFYMDLFEPTSNGSDDHHGIMQSNEIDLFSVSTLPSGNLKYTQAIRGNFSISVGCDYVASDASIIRGRFGVELKHHADCERLSNIVTTYMNKHFRTRQVHSINGVNTLVIGYMDRFPYLLLEEKDL